MTGPKTIDERLDALEHQARDIARELRFLLQRICVGAATIKPSDEDIARITALLESLDADEVAP